MIIFVFAVPFKNRGKLHSGLWAAAATSLAASAHILQLHEDRGCKAFQFR